VRAVGYKSDIRCGNINVLRITGDRLYRRPVHALVWTSPMASLSYQVPVELKQVNA